MRDRLRRDPFAALAGAVMVAAAYLCLVNLGYAALWHDEAPTALIGRNLLQHGDITGWDGRNLVGGTNGRTLNDDLRDVLPPLMYVVNAGSFALFGVSEASARVIPAVLGVVALALLYLLLRQHLREHPRLAFFCLLFAAWSPQLLLYFRQSRYYALMALTLIAGFYLYERWWRSGRASALGALTLVAALAFFNHYAGGAATMLALAVWHLLFRRRDTEPGQWLALAACGGLVVVLGAAYLGWIGVIGGERSGFHAYTGVTGLPEYNGTAPPLVLRLVIYVRELFTADWISWPVFLWFGGVLALSILSRNRSTVSGSAPRRRRHRVGGRRSPDAPLDNLPVAAAARIMLMGVLFALFSAALSPQAVWAFPHADLRYYMGALPLLLPMKGLFVEWLWRRWKIAGGAALAVLLLTSAGAWPFNARMLLTGERTLGLHLAQFVREIHRPYRDSIRTTSDYLLEHAGQDDLVYIPAFSDREALTFTVGHRVLFCCLLNEESPLPEETRAALPPRLVTAATTPDWIVLFGKLDPAYLAKIADFYTVAAQLDVFYYPTQRPEINLHAFSPLPAAAPGVHILRQIPSAALQAKADRFAADGQFRAAADAYAGMLEIDPDSAAAHAGLGRALALTHANLGAALYHLDRTDDAIASLERALALDPSLDAARSSLERIQAAAPPREP